MSDLSRRKFVQQLSLLGVLGAGGAMTGCGGGGGSSEGGGATDAEVGFSCMDTTGLEETDIAMRNTLMYTDQSETEGQTCDNCQLYVIAEAGSNCGTCTTVKGPIHPDGWCSIWAAQTA
ncbi:MAG: high-potential iron-sulfur protein [Bacteroidota bacterium]|nr:high-potential iron-sulfur protein [Bacteroidota bacterium]